MTTVFSWAIANLEHETVDGFVFTAHYTISAKDAVYSAGAYGSIGFERPDSLVAYSDITEEMVVEWVKDALTEEKVTSICEALQSQLDEQAAPTKAAGVPWNNAVS
ncbi:hypothetical protein UFOVP649_100 [uncultured Caudovirales phage]|uniref:DUF7936 domain-containing protein n=1 Tax=uncultured Caudovirales phage TaxID=2100421 RepID=A0A6J5NIJ1_9CAUD|nr:hypothetical protein UFOVP649_100 [uncultured Caudovirales phage]